jgi:hypothetical protein
MSKNFKNPNQSSSYSPNSIGGRIDEMLREKLMKQTNTQTNEKSVERYEKQQQPKTPPNELKNR